MDLIDKGAAIEAMKKWATQPVIMKSRYFDPTGKAIVLDMIGTVEGQPSVPAVPLDKLCKWLAENSMNIPCASCQHMSNDYCTAIGDMSKPCPKDADDWQKALTNWMEGLDAAD